MIFLLFVLAFFSPVRLIFIERVIHECMQFSVVQFTIQHLLESSKLPHPHPLDRLVSGISAI